MPRIVDQCHRRLHLPFAVTTWADIGSGDGWVATALSWNQSARLKVAVEPYRPATSRHGPEWRWVASYDQALALAGGTFDLVTMFDVIEHLEQAAGLALLQQVLATARAVVVFTPRGFLRQDATTHPEMTSPGARHRSGWEAEEFRALGLTVEVLRGFHDRPRGQARPWDALLAWRVAAATPAAAAAAPTAPSRAAG